MASSALLFALMGFFARLASSGVHWTSVAASRSIVGAIVAVAVARARGAPMRVRDRRGIWLRSVFGTVSMITTFYALASPALALGDSATMFALAPVFIAILSPFVLGERGGKRVMVAIPLSLSGVVLILKPPLLFGGAHLGQEATRTALIAAFSALTSAAAMMMVRRMGQRESPESIALHFSVVAAVVLCILAVPYLKVPSARDAGCMLAAGLCAGLAQLAMTRAYALEPAARVASIGYLHVVASALLGALALHEWPRASATLGMGLVIAGGLVIAFSAADSQVPRGRLQ